jgi:hypothetical protein
VYTEVEVDIFPCFMDTKITMAQTPGSDSSASAWSHAVHREGVRCGR